MIDLDLGTPNWTDLEWQTAGRALELWPKNPGAGFLSAAMDSGVWQSSKTRGAEIRTKFKRCVVVGVGGSSLGAQTLVEMAGAKNVFFLENLDPESILCLKSDIGDLGEVHWVWTSKTGSTIELLAVFELVRVWYKQLGKELKSHSTVVAGSGAGPIQDWAMQNGVPQLVIPASVSGRFSVFTPSGLVAAAVAGIDLDQLQAGVKKALDANDHARKLVASSLASWRRGEWVTIFWTYGDRLRPFAAWAQQLWAESLAKKVDRSGKQPPQVSFPVTCVGSRDQHSILQQIMEGARDKWVWIFQIGDLGKVEPKIASSLPATRHLEGRTLGQVLLAQAAGTSTAMKEAGISVCHATFPSFDAIHIGYGMFLMEIVVAALGEALNLDTYNQPGVERGKKITDQILRL